MYDEMDKEKEKQKDEHGAASQVPTLLNTG